MNLSDLVSQFLKLAPIAIGIMIVVIALVMIARKFERRSAAARMVITAFGKESNDRPLSAKKKLILFLVAGLLVAIPIIFKLLKAA